MKLPSLQYLKHQTIQALVSFPTVILSSILGTSVAVYLVEFEKDLLDLFPYINLMLCAALGIPLFFSIEIYSITHKIYGYKAWIARAIVAAVLALVYLTLPNSDDTQNTSLPYIRYAIYNISAHLLAAVIPYINRTSLNGFWNYNKTLFIRFWHAVLYSAFLYIGLTFALGAVDILFEIDVRDTLYGDLFIVVTGVFNTWFYVSGMRLNLDELESSDVYPWGLKILTQYILIPLLILYLVILYTYGTKVVLLWDWPKGIVSYLVICVSVLGILNLLLIYPFGHWTKGNEWIQKFSRVYYYLLIPLIAMLFIAIGMRIQDYGVTVNRYIISLLGIWLTITSVLFILNKVSIRFIPISLMIIIMSTSFGPWGMFSVSESSQINRLEEILNEAKILQNNKIQNEVIWNKDSLDNSFVAVKKLTNDHILSDSLHNEVYSIMSYLDDFHGFSGLSHWFSQNISEQIKIVNLSKVDYEKVSDMAIFIQTMGLRYGTRYSDANYASYYLTYGNAQQITDVSGFSYLIEVQGDSQYSDEIDLDSIKVKSNVSPDFEVKLITTTDTLTLSVQNILTKLLDHYGASHHENVSKEFMTVSSSNGLYRARLDLRSLHASITDDSANVDSFSGDLLIGKRIDQKGQ